MREHPEQVPMIRPVSSNFAVTVFICSSDLSIAPYFSVVEFDHNGLSVPFCEYSYFFSGTDFR